MTNAVLSHGTSLLIERRNSGAMLSMTDIYTQQVPVAAPDIPVPWDSLIG